MFRLFQGLIKTIVLIMTMVTNILASDFNIPKTDLDIISHVTNKLYDTTLDHITIEPIQKGFSGDRLYLVKYKDNLIIRIYKNNKSLEDKKVEVLCAVKAYDLGFGPKILYKSADLNVIATEFIEGDHPNITTFLNHNLLDSIACNLKKLHNDSFVNREWSVFDYIKNDVPQIIDNKTKLALEQLHKIQSSLHKANFPKKLCHNDIHSKNLFVYNDQILLIDWGDSGMSDPFWDLARVSMEFGFDSKQDERFLTQYLDKVSDLDRSRFYLMKQVFLLRTALVLNILRIDFSKTQIQDIIKIFEVNNYPLNINNKSINWSDVSHHAMELFLNNCKTDLFRKSLNMIEAESKK
ncbi:MAG: hypothetical protein EKK61_04805 [Rickettsiales bacterium]|nr:MAG: hypothetical protein EKK61_04805 [Rickettsiales bacterium]